MIASSTWKQLHAYELADETHLEQPLPWAIWKGPDFAGLEVQKFLILENIILATASVSVTHFLGDVSISVIKHHDQGNSKENI